MAALNRLRDAMQQLGKNSGVLNTNDPEINKQLSSKHPQRGELNGCSTTSMPTPAEYDMPEAHLPGTEGYIEVSVDRIQRKAARLKTERAKGPAGDYNEHMAPYGRKHPRGSPEEAAVEDFAFFVELYVNARLLHCVAQPVESGHIAHPICVCSAACKPRSALPGPLQ